MSDVIVLCYHALSLGWRAELSTTPERFERQISLLVARGYRCVTFTEAVGWAGDGRIVAVTFDDAYRSVLELARPILDRLQAPATVFVPTDSIGSPGPLRWPGIDRWLGGRHEPELTPMSWAELRSLDAAGWEIGSHTGSHPHLTQLDDDSLRAELTRSKAACEEHLAGHYHIEVVDLLENPRLAAEDQILAVPTVVRKFPAPIRKLVGDLSDNDRLLVGLQLRPPGSTRHDR